MKEYLKDNNLKYKSNSKVDKTLGRHITTIKINPLEMFTYLLYLPIFVIILGIFEDPFTTLGIAFVFSIIEVYLLIKYFRASKINIFQYGMKYKKLSVKFDDLEIVKNSNIDYSFNSSNIKEKYKPLKISKNNKRILDGMVDLVKK